MSDCLTWDPVGVPGSGTVGVGRKNLEFSVTSCSESGTRSTTVVTGPDY